MPRTIIVDNVSKSYVLGGSAHRTFRETVMGAFGSLFGGRREPRGKLIWALNGVSLEVEQGEVVGLIGRNGAGKSTLLKILSRITYPTSGRIDVTGRVGSLLEVGTGFHDELTGRENIYMNGSILGMKKREIDAAMDEIIAFAEIDDFLDTPIKRYSSGMRMRLGFAVAAHLRTDVLFVDEVLAVGDLGFQKKCLGAMRELGEGGRTVVFVSHNMATVENLCKRSIWIADGRVKQMGETREVIQAYLNSFGATSKQTLDLSAIPRRHGTGLVRMVKMELLNKDGGEGGVVHSGDSLWVRFYYESAKDLPNLHFGLRIFSNLGTKITEAHTWATGESVPLVPEGPGSIDLKIDFLNLMPGTYYLGVWVASFEEYHDEMDNVATLDVEPSNYYGTGRGIESRFGFVFLDYRWIPNGNSSNAEALPEHSAISRGSNGNGVAHPLRSLSQ
jgi:lipopolysaccharide transport system ATP-binding protein